MNKELGGFSYSKIPAKFKIDFFDHNVRVSVLMLTSLTGEATRLQVVIVLSLYSWQKVKEVHRGLKDAELVLEGCFTAAVYSLRGRKAAA